MQKDRARQELRALLADPAAGFAALPGGQFFAALKQACEDGTANPALIADCERRITSREVGPRELHQVLFAASDRHAWAGVRALALAAAGQVPGTAAAVVGLEAQRLGVAPMQVTESAAGGGFTATASLERDGARVEGKAGYGGSKKTARQAAALSLLARRSSSSANSVRKRLISRLTRVSSALACCSLTPTIAVPARASASPSRRSSLRHGVPPAYRLGGTAACPPRSRRRSRPGSARTPGGRSCRSASRPCAASRRPDKPWLILVAAAAQSGRAAFASPAMVSRRRPAAYSRPQSRQKLQNAEGLGQPATSYPDWR